MKNLSAGLGAGVGNRSASRTRATVFLSAFLIAAPLVSAPAFANQTMTQLIEIMHANGSINDAQFAQLKSAAAQDDNQASMRQAQNLRSTNQGLEAESLEKSQSNEAFRKEIDDKLAKFDWASKVKLKGDLRLRYEYDNLDGRRNAAGNSVDRSRGRLRYRLGVITAPTDKLEVGAGLASGGDDPRSTNQTFGNDFSSKGINLDYAYAQYKFTKSLSAIGGKFKFSDYLWAPTDLIWDGDINPEGASAHYQFNEGDNSTFANGGVWVLQEFANNSSDPYLYYAQLGQNITVGNVFASLAGTYYGYENTAQPGTFNPDYSAGTNTTDQFRVVEANGELGTKFDGGKASLIGQYVRNIQSGVDQDTGYAAGGKVSVDKWSMKYLYGDLDANAVPDVFPDSDRQGGATDMKGHEIAGAYQLTDAVELGLDYYNTQRKSIDLDDQLLQADVLIKF